MKKYKVTFTVKKETELKYSTVSANSKKDIKSVLMQEYQIDEIISSVELNPHCSNVCIETKD